MKHAGLWALVFVLAVPVWFVPGAFAAKADAPKTSKAAKTAPAAPAAPASENGGSDPQGDVKTSDAPAEDAPGRIIKEPASFNGVKWGTRLEDAPELKVIGEYGGVRYASVPDAVYRIGDVFINSATFAFCDQGFAAVRLEFTGRDKLDSIARIIGEKYSAPVRLEAGVERFGLPLGNVLIMLEYDPKTDAGALGYSYRPIFDECMKKAK